MKLDQTDEGYVEQKFEEPEFIKDWSDDRKAEFAYQLLLCIPISKTIKVVDRLSPLLHKDYISALPNEIAIQILYYLDINTLSRISRLSKRWKSLCEDQTLWKSLFFSAGWTINQTSIQQYLSEPKISAIPITKSPKLKPFLLIRNQIEEIRSSQSSIVLRPTHVHSSRSQPIIPRREIVSHTIVERPFMNRPIPRKHTKYDETVIYHYQEEQDVRYINWKRLYRNRISIDRRWQDGKYKLRPFPPTDYLTESQHNSGIYCLQFNSKILVTGSRDRNIKIWDLKSGQIRHVLEGHRGSVLCLQFDHQHLLSGSSDSSLILWDLETGKKIKKLTGHQESVLNVKFLNNLVVSCSKDRTVRTWDLDKGQCQMIFRGHRAAVNAVQFKGNRIVSASGDRTIKIWDMNTGECLNTLDSHSRGIACVEYDGEHIVSGSSDQTIKIWNARTGECIHTLIGHTDLVRTLQLDPKTRTIVSGSYDGTLKIWKIDDGRLIRTLTQTEHGRILNLQFDFSKIICCSNLGKIVMYDFTFGMDTQFLL